MNIEREELDHILWEFSSKNLYHDMAMFFITQDLDYDEIFLYDLNTPVSFYKKVFTTIFCYIVDKINRGQIDLAIRDVIGKLRCYTKTKKLTERGIIIRDGFAYKLIEGTLRYLCRNKADLNGCNFIIDAAIINPEIDNDIIYECMKANPELCHQYIISNIISSEYMSVDQLLELILERGRVTDTSTVRELVLEIFNNKDMLLRFAVAVFRRFNIWIDTRNDRKDVHVDCLERGWKRELLEDLRIFLREIIWIDAELEFYDFLIAGQQRHAASKAMYMSNVYKTYIAWFGSKLREDTSMSNMLWLGYEEDFDSMHIDDECLLELSCDVVNLLYITDIGLLEGYNLFIRMFNLNRFKMCFHRNTQTVWREFYTMEQDEVRYYAGLAVSMNFYIFLCFI